MHANLPFCSNRSSAGCIFIITSSLPALFGRVRRTRHYSFVSGSRARGTCGTELRVQRVVTHIIVIIIITNNIMLRRCKGCLPLLGTISSSHLRARRKLLPLTRWWVFGWAGLCILCDDSKACRTPGQIKWMRFLCWLCHETMYRRLLNLLFSRDVGARRGRHTFRSVWVRCAVAVE